MRHTDHFEQGPASDSAIEGSQIDVSARAKSFPTTKWHVALGLALALVLVSLVFTLSTGRPVPAITLHYLGANQAGALTVLNLAVSNHTSHVYALHPVRLEFRQSPVWKKRETAACASVFGDLGPHGLSTITCALTDLRSKERLRVIVEIRKAAQGLDSF